MFFAMFGKRQNINRGPNKMGPLHIWHVNENIIYANLNRVPHVGFAFFFIGCKFKQTESDWL